MKQNKSFFLLLLTLGKIAVRNKAKNNIKFLDHNDASVIWTVTRFKYYVISYQFINWTYISLSTKLRNLS